MGNIRKDVAGFQPTDGLFPVLYLNTDIIGVWDKRGEAPNYR